MKLLLCSETTPAVVEYIQSHTDDGDPVASMRCLVCGWVPPAMDFSPDGPGSSLDDNLQLAEVHVDKPHPAPFPAMVARPNRMDTNPDGSLFGYDMADMIDRFDYEPAGDITDETVTAVAPILAALLAGEVRRTEEDS